MAARQFSGQGGSRPTLNANDERLHRVERQEWWRWITVIAITLLLTAGVFALSLPTLRRDFEEQNALNMALPGSWCWFFCLTLSLFISSSSSHVSAGN